MIVLVGPRTISLFRKCSTPLALILLISVWAKLGAECPAIQAKLLRESSLISSGTGKIDLIRRDTGEILRDESGNLLEIFETEVFPAQIKSQRIVFSDFGNRERILLFPAERKYQKLTLNIEACKQPFDHESYVSGIHEPGVAFRESRVSLQNLKGDWVDGGFMRFSRELRLKLESDFRREHQPGVVNREWYRVDGIEPLQKGRFAFSLPEGSVEITGANCCSAGESAKQK